MDCSVLVWFSFHTYINHVSIYWRASTGINNYLQVGITTSRTKDPKEGAEAKRHMIIKQVALTSRGFQSRCFPLTLPSQTNAQDAIWTSCLSPFTLPGVLLKLFSEQTVQLSCRRVNKSRRRAGWGKGLFTRHQIKPVCSHWPVAVTWAENKATLPPLLHLLLYDIWQRTLNITIILKFYQKKEKKKQDIPISKFLTQFVNVQLLCKYTTLNLGLVL